MKRNSGRAKFVALVASVVAGLAISPFLIPKPAAASVEYAHKTTSAVKNVNSNVGASIEKVIVDLERGAKLGDELADAQSNPSALRAKVDELNELAERFRVFAQEREQMRRAIQDGTRSIETVSGKIESDAEAAREVQDRLEAEAEKCRSADAKEGKLLAAKLAGERAALWDAFEQTNEEVKDGLKQFNHHVEKLAEIASANADVFEQAAANVTLASDMGRTAAILSDATEADVERLAAAMRKTWKSLSDSVSQMTTEAERLAKIEKSK